MDNYSDNNEQIEKLNYNMYVNKGIIDLENAMETMLLFYDSRCDVISYNVINTITLEYLPNADIAGKQTVSTLIENYFNLYKKQIKKIVAEGIIYLKNNIGNIDQVKYNEELGKLTESIIKKAGDYYLLHIRELVTEIVSIDKEYSDKVYDYLSLTVFKRIIEPLEDKLKYYIAIINNNYIANGEQLKIINEKTLK